MIRLTFREMAGTSLNDHPITFGVPLPIGELASDRSVLIRDPQGMEIPCQVDTTGYWADGSVKWLTVDFQATVKAGRRVEYQVEYGNEVKPGVFESPLRVSDNADSGPTGCVLYCCAHMAVCVLVGQLSSFEDGGVFVATQPPNCPLQGGERAPRPRQS